MHEKFRECLKNHAARKINWNNFKVILNRKKKKSLTNKQQESHENAKICYICDVTFEDKYVKDKNIIKLEIAVIIQMNTEVLHMVYVI